ncbi:MAG: MGDG synthase family glycosyltransferase [Tuberibacillus sp.]
MNKIKPNDKILILTGHYGAGHLQAAAAIQSALQKQYPTVETTVIDPEAAFRKIYGMIGHKLFIGTVKRFPSLYNYLYQKTRYPSYLSAILKGSNHLGIEKFLAWIKNVNPSIIVSTDPVSSGMVSILKKRGLINVPFVTVITDYAVHSYWINPSVDQYLVGSESVRKGLLQFGVADFQIKVTGIPINPKFNKVFDRSALKKKHGLDDRLPIILVTGGGYGLVGNNISLKKMLQSIPYPVQLIVVCGHNKHLYKMMEKEIKDIAYPVHLKGYVENMEELMAITDVMITKPGGLSISEAVSMNIPMVLYQSLGGHEQENTRYLLSNHAAIFAGDKDDLFKKVAMLIAHPELRQQLMENTKRIQRKHSAIEAALVIKSTLATQVRYEPVPLYQYSLK